MKNLLIIFAKAPEAGRVKTRLSPHLAPETASRLQKAFLLDILKISRSLKASRWMACAPDTRHAFFQRCEKEAPIRLIQQEGADLGERMQNAFQTAFSEGFESVLIIGCDAPTLPVSYINDAFEQLEKNAVVVGPSLDGGYYLIGAKDPLPDLFSQMNWGTERVLNETLKRLNTSKKRYHLLPFWYDIDLPVDLDFLKHHLHYRAMKGETKLTATTKILDEIAFQ